VKFFRKKPAVDDVLSHIDDVERKLREGQRRNVIERTAARITQFKQYKNLLVVLKSAYPRLMIDGTIYVYGKPYKRTGYEQERDGAIVTIDYASIRVAYGHRLIVYWEFMIDGSDYDLPMTPDQAKTAVYDAVLKTRQRRRNELRRKRHAGEI
jgi:hypothetical protein